MKTTVDIPNDLLKEAMQYSNSNTKRDAVLAALEEFTRKHRQAAMVKHLGTFKDFITPQELADARQNRQKRRK
jgi:Arc/MetJ family transcription regulator